MNVEKLRALQAPFKEKYKADAASAMITLKAQGSLAADVVCKVQTPAGVKNAGLHPAAGGDDSVLCAGDMMLEALVGCTGVTLQAVATALSIPIRGGTIRVEGDMDFRGTLAVAKDVPVGFQNIRLILDLDTDATPEQINKLVELTKRYCVVYQTLSKPPVITTSIAR